MNTVKENEKKELNPEEMENVCGSGLATPFWNPYPYLDKKKGGNNND